MKRSTYLSLGLFLAVTLWMLSGAITSAPEAAFSKEESAAVPQAMKVRVLEVTAEEIDREIVIQGELEPLRQVEIKAQTASRVINLPVNRGDRVAAGSLLIQLAEEDRIAQLKRAEAEVSSQKHEVSAIRELKKKGLQSETRAIAADAALATAEALLERARIELGYTDIKAPFDGVMEERYVELGSHVEQGDRVALLVDGAVLKAVGRVSQQSAGKLSLGQQIDVQLLDGSEARGRVTYIASLGDSGTHSFRVEAEVPNPEGLLNAGTSAEIRIAIGRETAHFLSPAVLSLDAKGEVGVKVVNDDSVVDFYPVTLVRTEANGIWVSGLPERARVIGLGQGFVSAGESVVPVPAS
ncbi:MAG: efflux RND transporter periplasmic adaptor subunit [Thiogranum sp.]